MRKPTVSSLLRDIGIGISGMVLGACVYHALFLHQINELVMMNIDLQDHVSHYRTEAQDLLKYKNKQTVIKSIDVHIYNPSTQRIIPQGDQAEIKRRLLNDLKGLKGRDVFQIDEYSKLVEGLLKNKIYPDIFEKDYTVALRTMLVTEGVLHVWIDVHAYVGT
ncbi:hypothetical protein [Paenibacillus sp. 481]|uniref:hypothetical protein n=1 Tax=Paenibacillus sp. 481 TaxID=2835869 RepID=UPI001E4798E0|nr:hypothetical protein [Paenibacillus sp. 481]UHA72425.1 hypothetical protein KIK04_17345 [Paenibacillus sp. 481]